MHVIIITNDFPPRVGGMATHAWELSKALVRQGNRVTVITGAEQALSPRRPRFQRVEQVEGVRIIHVASLGFFRSQHMMRSTQKILNRVTRENGGDVVLHLQEMNTPTRVRRISTLPIVWTNHSSAFLYAYDDPRKHSMLKEMLSACDRVTAPSRELHEKAVQVGFEPLAASYIPNGVDVRDFMPRAIEGERGCFVAGQRLAYPADRCVVVCARRFVEKNGLHVYLDALEALDRETLARSVFLFAGNKKDSRDPYSIQITNRIHRLGERAECKMLGSLDNQSMQQLYPIADISVLPSLMEATSITGLESMACALPIVGTNVGGIPEIVIDGVTGLLCPPSDSEAFAANLESMIHDSAMRTRMGQAARQHVLEHFSWDVIARQYMDIYKSCSNREALVT